MLVPFELVVWPQTCASWIDALETWSTWKSHPSFRFCDFVSVFFFPCTFSSLLLDKYLRSYLISHPFSKREEKKNFESNNTLYSSATKKGKKKSKNKRAMASWQLKPNCLWDGSLIFEATSETQDWKIKSDGKKCTIKKSILLIRKWALLATL